MCGGEFWPSFCAWRSRRRLNTATPSSFPAPTDGDIAARIATTRETVNREFKWLEKSGVIEKRGRTLVIPDFEEAPTSWWRSGKTNGLGAVGPGLATTSAGWTRTAS